MTGDATPRGGLTYAGAGVDIDAGEEAVRRIKPHVASTFGPEVLSDVGGFGGLYAFPADRYDQPVLVSGTDSVGTKAVVAARTRRYDTIGIDAVAMCVDDIAAQGARPLFFLDTILVGRLVPDDMEALVAGVAEGCRRARCALIGGEMAENPGLMGEGEFELVGTAVGAVDRARVVTGERVTAGDVVLGLPSPNLRCNGFSLARRAFLDHAGRDLDGPAWDGADHSLADELLAPSVIYAPALVDLADAVEVRAMAHVTGGGLAGNLCRVLPDGLAAEIDGSAWDVPQVFRELQRVGEVAPAEMARVFNLGVGMCAVVPAGEVDDALSSLAASGHEARPIGRIVEGRSGVSGPDAVRVDPLPTA